MFVCSLLCYAFVVSANEVLRLVSKKQVDGANMMTCVGYRMTDELCAGIRWITVASVRASNADATGGKAKKEDTAEEEWVALVSHARNALSFRVYNTRICDSYHFSTSRASSSSAFMLSPPSSMKSSPIDRFRRVPRQRHNQSTPIIDWCPASFHDTTNRKQSCDWDSFHWRWRFVFDPQEMFAFVATVRCND